jgi:hypothetical protein
VFDRHGGESVASHPSSRAASSRGASSTQKIAGEFFNNAFPNSSQTDVMPEIGALVRKVLFAAVPMDGVASKICRSS